MSDLSGPVEVIGTGMVGTSIALALTRAGVEVLLSDANPEHVRTATSLGAGRPRTAEDRPQLVVVAVPPDHLGTVIAAALAASDAVVTDVGSVKSAPLGAVAGRPGEERYVGSHPMAGSEQSGPLAASETLFDGRPWAITPHPAATVESVELVEALVGLCGATKVFLTPAEHDRAVARTSHVPHLLATLVAARLAGAPENHLVLSGQGVRDVTRVAAGDPALYSQIVAGNADAVLALLGEVREQLDDVIEAVGAGDRGRLRAVLEDGVAGTRAIPGKHGGPTRPMASVWVSIPDAPGALARLFADAVASEVNIEDIHIDHDPGRETGLVELVVEAGRAEHLLTSLESRSWVTHR
jgi:prephenate dehydrogenase